MHRLEVKHMSQNMRGQNGSRKSMANMALVLRLIHITLEEMHLWCGVYNILLIDI